MQDTTMDGHSITVRQMRRAELDEAIEWARTEGWNPGLHDAEIFWQFDPSGFLALELNGEMVGGGSVVSYDGKFGFMGLFIVKPEWRGLGLGTKLWRQRRNVLRSRIAQDAAIGMDGVFAMQQFYAKGGFEFSHRNLRMRGIGQELDYDKSRVTDASVDALSLLLPIDRRCFGIEREKFLKLWISQPDSLTMHYREDDVCLGFGTIRKCIEGWKIGPLFALTNSVADQIFRALNIAAKGEPIYLDVPENNRAAIEMAKLYDLKECFGCARMYLGEPPEQASGEVFGVTTFELG